MFNIHQLRSFVMVVSEGSMTEAAKKLYLTQPAISQQIRHLEEDLGVDLLLRGTRTIRPTLQGELLFEHSRRILQMVQQTETAIKMMGNQLTGFLRIGTLNSLGVQLVSPVVGRLLKFNPKLSFEVDFDEEKNILAKFRSGHLDVVILPEKSLEGLESVEKKLLFKEEMWLVGSGRETDLPRQIQFQDLKSYALMWLTREYSDFEKTLKEKIDTSLGWEFVKTAFSTSNVGTLKRVIETGLGWGFLPSMAVKKQVRSGRMTRIQVRDFEYHIHFYYCYQSDLSSDQRSLTEALFIALDTLDRP
jgi:LysR family transcriptional regulator, transcriptional activator of the cysJI operon